MTSATNSGQWRPSDTLANRLRLVRGELGLSQREAADRAGITARVWQNAEDGRTIRSERAVLAAIALAFNLDREWLAWGGALNGNGPHPGNPDGGTPNMDLGIKSPKLFQLSYRGTSEDTNVVPMRGAVAA